eukprot:TRINITY_DN28950_c0_g1_i1.p1 TRINITY_DN28950_c0_g1~~TRINITY_DN28950_c0_g1_i1.p1  ORF type:complete len:752 (+),score=262.34 TRINITY_DN28950_c0_g1_i1:44-2257(+)
MAVCGCCTWRRCCCCSFCTVLVLVVLGGIVFAAASQRAAIELLDKGMEELRKEKFAPEDAREKLRQMYALCPQTGNSTVFGLRCARVALTLGFEQKAAKEVVAADHSFREALRWEPRLVKAWEERALIADHKGETARAARLLEKGLDATAGEPPLPGDSPRSNLQVALAKHVDSDEKRIPLLRSAIESDPHPHAQLLLAEALLRKGSPSKALPLFRAASRGKHVPSDERGRAAAGLCQTEDSDAAVLDAVHQLQSAKAAPALRTCLDLHTSRSNLKLAEQIAEAALDVTGTAQAHFDYAFLRMRRHGTDRSLSLAKAAVSFQEAMKGSAPAPDAVKWKSAVGSMKRQEQPRWVAPPLPAPDTLPRCPTVGVADAPSAQDFERMVRDGQRPLRVVGGGKLQTGADWSAEGLKASAAADYQVMVNFADDGGYLLPVLNATSSTGGKRLTAVGEAVQRLAKQAGGAAGEFVARQGPGGAGLTRGALVVARAPQTQMFLRDLVTLSTANSAVRPMMAPLEAEVYTPLLFQRFELPTFARKLKKRVASQMVTLGAGGTVTGMAFEQYDRLTHVIAGSQDILLLPPTAYADLGYGPLLEVHTQLPGEGIKSLRKPYAAGAKVEATAAQWEFARSPLNLSAPAEWGVERVAAALLKGGACTMRAEAGDAVLIPAWWSRQVHSSGGADGMDLSLQWLVQHDRILEDAREDAYTTWGGFAPARDSCSAADDSCDANPKPKKRKAKG